MPAIRECCRAVAVRRGGELRQLGATGDKMVIFAWRKWFHYGFCWRVYVNVSAIDITLALPALRAQATSD